MKSVKKQPKVEAPAAPQWFCVWYHTCAAKSLGVDGSERPALMRPMAPQMTHVKLLMLDEVLGVKSLTVPLADTKYMRPVITPDGKEYDAVRMLESYRRWAQTVAGGALRGATPDAARELGISVPTHSAGPSSKPEPEWLTLLYFRAERLCEMPVDELREKYRHCNPGMQGMQLRGAIRRAGFQV